MSKQFLFVGADGLYEATPGAYEQTDFVAESTGAPDAGKPLKLDARGKLAPSLYVLTDVEHDSINGVALSEAHQKFPLLAGGRDFSAVMKYDAIKSFSDGREIPDKNYVDSLAAGLDPKQSCQWATQDAITGTYNASGGTGGTGSFSGVDLTDTGDFDLDGGTIGLGDRILVKDQTVDAKQNGLYIVTLAGATGTVERASDHDGSPANEVSGGNFTFVENGADHQNTGWTLQGTGTLTLNSNDLIWVQFSGAGLLYPGSGLTKDGNTLNVGEGDGVNVLADTIEVDVTDFIDTDYGLQADANDIQINLEANGGLQFDATNHGIEIKPDAATGPTLVPITVATPGVGVTLDNDTLTHTTGTLHVKDDGVHDSQIDWGSGVGQVNAADLPILDSGSFTDETDAEGALQELFRRVNHVGKEYNVDTGEVVALGDLVEFSAANVLARLDIDAAGFGVGLSDRAATAGFPIIPMPNGTVLAGVLAGATPGQKYFWNGTGHQTALPSGSGQYVWLTAVAINANDAMVMRQFIRRNAS